MTTNKKQAKALEILINKMGEMSIIEETDNDGSKYITCYCSILDEGWIINSDGECYDSKSCLWIDEDQNWVA